MEQVATMQDEWTEERIVPGIFNRRDTEPEAWLQYTIANRFYALQPFVTSDAWVLVDRDRNPLGALALRHELNESLLQTGGHIGYGIRPAARGRKLAPCMLALGLEKAKERGVSHVLVTCNEDNPASARTIEDCGGLYENSFTEEDGTRVRRYWIELHCG